MNLNTSGSLRTGLALNDAFVTLTERIATNTIDNQGNLNVSGSLAETVGQRIQTFSFKSSQFHCVQGPLLQFN